nr:hypothetical protein [Microvirga arsenatis]
MSYTAKDTAIAAVQGGNAYVTVVAASGQTSGTNRYELTAKLFSAKGGEQRSITLTSGFGVAPAFAVETLEDGRFIVVWSQFNHIKAQIFKEDGTAEGQVLDLHSSSSIRVLNINVKAIKSGFALVFQQETTSSPPNSDTYLATYTLSGEPKGVPRTVHDSNSGLQETPTLTTLADGRIVVSWKDSAGIVPGIQSRIFDDRYEPVNLAGTSGNDAYFGSEFDDTLTGGDGDDVLHGGAGNDYFEAKEAPDNLGNYRGKDIFNGNEGDQDKVSYWNVTNDNQTGVKIYLGYQQYNGGAAEGDSFNSIEVIDGTDYADVIEGDASTNIFWGDNGNDTLSGGGGNDEVNGGAGDDVLDGGVISAAVPDDDTLFGGEGNDFMWGRGGGNDVFDGGDGVDKVSYYGPTGIALYMQRLGDGTIVATGASRGAAAGDVFRSIEIVDGTTQADTIEGTTGAQVFWGAQGADVLKGHDGNDELNGGVDNDTLSGGTGGDRLVGEAGFDWASYAETASGVSVSLASGQGLAGEAAGDTLIGIEALLGSRFDDTLAGAAHELHGGLGNDTYQVGAGTLVAEGAGQGIDTVVASGSYSLAPSAEVEVLRLASAGGLEAYSLTGSNAANAISGNAGANALNGLDGNDTLTGEAGNDAIAGGNGNDRLVGGLGKDMLSGGTGLDIFVFDTKANKKVNLDQIADFVVKDDSFWLDNAVFTKLGKKGSVTNPAQINKKFFVVGSAAKDKDDYLIYNKAKGVLLYDADGSGKGKAVEITTLSKKLAMTHKDFFVI